MLRLVVSGLLGVSCFAHGLALPRGGVDMGVPSESVEEAGVRTLRRSFGWLVLSGGKGYAVLDWCSPDSFVFAYVSRELLTWERSVDLEVMVEPFTDTVLSGGSLRVVPREPLSGAGYVIVVDRASRHWWVWIEDLSKEVVVGGEGVEAGVFEVELITLE